VFLVITVLLSSGKDLCASGSVLSPCPLNVPRKLGQYISIVRVERNPKKFYKLKCHKPSSEFHRKIII
jgi:hypothetical protein